MPSRRAPDWTRHDIIAQGFERGGHGVLGDGARAPQTRVRKKNRACFRRGHIADLQRFFPAGSRHVLRGNGLTLVQSGA